MKKINPNIFPKDGYYFSEKDGVKIVGSTWGGVIARVAAYRKRAGYTPGDPTREVMEQACNRNPGACSEENGAYRAAVTVASLKGRVLQWFMSLKKRRGKEPISFVNDEEAARRRGVCRGCPFNTAIPEGCSSCRAAVSELRADIIGSGRYVDPVLVQHACSIIGSDLATSNWLDEVTEDIPQLPAHCWKKRTL